MGTRGLLIIKKDGKYVVAQYHHWDSYPEKLGYEIVKFLNNLNNYDKFIEQLDYLKMVPKDEINNYEYINYFSGYLFLDEILTTKEEIYTRNDLHLFKDGDLEWAYLIDFDSYKLYIYYDNSSSDSDADSNSNISPCSSSLNDDSSLELKSNYLKLFTTYKLNKLPFEEVLKNPRYEEETKKKMKHKAKKEKKRKQKKEERKEELDKEGKEIGKRNEKKRKFQ